MHNTRIEKSLNRKMRPRYLGPYVVLSRNRGGAYIICDLDGSVFDRPVAAFRLLPYLARSSISIPWLTDNSDIFDITTARLREMEASTSQGDDDDLLDDNDDAGDNATPLARERDGVGEYAEGAQVPA